MSIQDNFNEVPRAYGTIWQHKEKPVWIVFYNVTHRDPFYMAYQVKDYELPLKKGREIWAHDNKSISPESGFKTLEDAMGAIA